MLTILQTSQSYPFWFSYLWDLNPSGFMSWTKNILVGSLEFLKIEPYFFFIEAQAFKANIRQIRCYFSNLNHLKMTLHLGSYILCPDSFLGKALTFCCHRQSSLDWYRKSLNSLYIFRSASKGTENTFYASWVKISIFLMIVYVADH